VNDVTVILRRVEAGDRAAVDELFSAVYDELHTLAIRQRGRWSGDETIGATALVHEAYLKLVGQTNLRASSRAHFFALAARAMRHILSNYAKRKRRQKRGGGAIGIPLDALGPDTLGIDATWTDEQAALLLALDGALRGLESLNERQARVVECRFYGGMSIPDTATALAISPATVKRDWSLAQAWLYRELKVHT
jgi:RNA polymerase sigma factor (TIGR02999 family)